MIRSIIQSLSVTHEAAIVEHSATLTILGLGQITGDTTVTVRFTEVKQGMAKFLLGWVTNKLFHICPSPLIGVACGDV